MEKMFHVYILASRRGGVLYIGVTSDLRQRIWQYKYAHQPGFSHRYNVSQLVWYEASDSPVAAIQREKQLKRWRRLWKIRLIEEMNPEWRDLYGDICA